VEGGVGELGGQIQLGEAMGANSKR
jgi:hypothetical protein